MKNKLFASLALAWLSTLNPQLSTLFAQGTAFTYQGRLDDSGQAANGIYDLQFALFNAASGGAQVSTNFTYDDLSLSNGLFTVSLDFGNVFDGQKRWLEISARPGTNTGNFSGLSPRQPLNPAPYAMYAPAAGSAGTANNAITAGFANSASSASIFLGSLNGDVTGGQGSTAVSMVGGQTAANVAAGAGAASGATSANTPNTIVKRDPTGSFSAGTINSTNFSGNAINLYDLNAAKLVGTISSANIAAGSVTTSSLANGAVSIAKLNTATTELFSTGFTNPAPSSVDKFGASIAAVSSDKVLIGAYDNGPGAAYLFNINGALLTTFPVPPTSEDFGFSLAAVGSDKVLIGAYRDNTGAASDAGVAHLFSTNGTLLITFTNPAPANFSFFGISVSTLDENRVLIGATGGQRVYLFSTSGSLLMTFTNPAVGGNFAWSVAAVGPDKVLVGARSGGTLAGGTAYLFSTNGTLLTTFTNPTPAASEEFGASVAAVGPDQVLIGARSAGAAYLFNTNGTLLRTFTRPTPGSSHLFGDAVSAVGGDKVLIGASRDDLVANDSGAAYLFSTDGTLLATFTDPTQENDAHFGEAVCVVGAGHILVGAPHGNLSGPNPGAAYLFSLSNPYISGLVAEHVLDDSINSASLAAGSVTDAKISSVDAAKITSGTLADARLSANVALLDLFQTFTSQKNFTAPVAFGSGAQIRAAVGTNSAPGLAFELDGNTGLFRPAADTLAFVTGGTERFRISSSGDVSIGTTAAEGKLTVEGAEWRKFTGSEPAVSASQHLGFDTGGGTLSVNAYWNGSSWTREDTNEVSLAYIQHLSNRRHEFRVASDHDATVSWTTAMVILTNGNVGIGTSSPTNKLHVAGGVSATVFVTTSDRDAKQNFTPVSARDVLEKVATLSIAQWQFKDMPGIPHLGPTAQDFHARFGLGGTDTGIATVDADGVALAAIQGLNQKVEEKDAEIRNLRARLEKLEQLLSRDTTERK